MSEIYDLVVIGAGSGGVRAARMSANYGARVAIIEEYRVGGTCVIRGCVPKKLFVYASHFVDYFDVAKSFGWQVEASFDWSVLKSNKDREIDRLERAYVSNLEKAGVELIRDRAIVRSAGQVELAGSGKILEARNILVATGGRPFVPEFEGADLAITSNEVFELETLPGSVLIEGGGYIAVEFAGIFSGLGVETTVCYRGDHLLRGFDEDVRQGVTEGLAARGVKFCFNTTVSRLRPNGDGVAATFADGQSGNFGAAMFATGRIPNVTDFGLREAGVALDAKGAISVDGFAQTSVPNIYAVGDVSGGPALTPVAIRQGAALAETLFNKNPTEVDLSLVPTAVFTEPEVGTIGLSEEDARANGDIDVYVTRFRPMMNTLSDRPEKIMLKLVTEAGGGRVLGCHVLGPGAAEMIQMVAIPMSMGANKGDFDRAIAVHPSTGEELVTFKGPSYQWIAGVRKDA